MLQITSLCLLQFCTLHGPGTNAQSALPDPATRVIRVLAISKGRFLSLFVNKGMTCAQVRQVLGKQVCYLHGYGPGYFCLSYLELGVAIDFDNTGWPDHNKARVTAVSFSMPMLIE